MKKRYVLLFFLLCLPLFCCKVSANSAIRYWSGSESHGLVLKEENCPLEVAKEDLDFYIHHFPNSIVSIKDIDSYVSAKYTFYNPTDEDITATLLFPFGVRPTYLVEEVAEDGSFHYVDDTLKYDIKLNDQVLTNKKIRYSYGNQYDFDINRDMDKLKSDYVSGGTYQPDLPVYHYTYQITKVPDGKEDVFIEFCMNDQDVMSVVTNRFDYYNDCYHLYSGCVGDTFDIYLIGKNVENFDSRLKFYADTSFKYETEGGVTQLSFETKTFEDLIFHYYEEDSTISKMDWYNAVMDKLSTANDFTYLSFFDIYNELMRWYEYELFVPAKQEVLNEVIAPLYPDINDEYDPPKYNFTYLLSPATTWNKFSNLTIRIHSSMFLLESSLSEELTPLEEEGYELYLESLPEGELQFTLCASLNPQHVYRTGTIGWIVLAVIILLTFLAVPLIIFIVVLKQGKPAKEWSPYQKNIRLCYLLEAILSLCLLGFGIVGLTMSSLSNLIFGILCILFSLGILSLLIIENFKFHRRIIGRIIFVIAIFICYILGFAFNEYFSEMLEDTCVISFFFGIVFFIITMVIWSQLNQKCRNSSNEEFESSKQHVMPVGYLSKKWLNTFIIILSILIVAMIVCFIVLSLNDYALLFPCIGFILGISLFVIIYAILMGRSDTIDFKYFYQDLDYFKLEKNVLAKLERANIHPETKNYYLILLASCARVVSLERYQELCKQLVEPKSRLYRLYYDLFQLNFLLPHEAMQRQASQLMNKYTGKRRVIKRIQRFAACWEAYYTGQADKPIDELVPYDTKNQYLNGVHLFIQINYEQHQGNMVETENKRALFMQRYGALQVLKDELEGVDIRANLVKEELERQCPFCGNIMKAKDLYCSCCGKKYEEETKDV